MRQLKNKKREQKRGQAKEEDEFDSMFKQHKMALLKKLTEKSDGPAFEEVEMSD